MRHTIHIVPAVVAMVCLTFSSASAQDDAVPRDAAQKRTQQTAVDAGRLDDKTRGGNVRASELIGRNIQNPQGESLGEIEDLVIDSRTGKISYAAVTYGGLLGIGDKLFAVPFEAFSVRVDQGARGFRLLNRDNYVLVLNVTQQQLEGQEGFDKEHWPDMADQAWAKDLDKRYGVKRGGDAKDRLLRENRRQTDNR